MSRQRIEIHLPTVITAGQLIAAMTTTLASLGHDLGTRYDVHMSVRAGADWLEKLRLVRAAFDGHDMYRRPLNLYDPSFCLNEPLRHSDSPLRECLPKGREFYDLLDAVAKVRNQAQHFDGRLDARRLRERVQLVRDLAQQIGLETAGDCVALLQRVDALVAAGGAMPDHRRDEVDQLQQQLKVEQERAAELSRQAAEAASRLRASEAADRTHLDSAAEKDAENERLRLELEQLKAMQALAADQSRTTRRALQERRTEDRASDSPVSDIVAGAAWSGPPGPHHVRLLAHVRDLYDPTSRSLLSDELGEVAVQAARRWLQFLPHGGPLHLDDAGRACALIGSSWVYLGRLDGD